MNTVQSLEEARRQRIFDSAPEILEAAKRAARSGSSLAVLGSMRRCLALAEAAVATGDRLATLAEELVVDEDTRRHQERH